MLEVLPDGHYLCPDCGSPRRADTVSCDNCDMKDSDSERSNGEISDVCFPKDSRRRYAKAVSVFEIGIWSVESLEQLFGIMLGSMDGVRNSYEELKRDNARMRLELGRLGLVYSSCFCPELSPLSHVFVKRDGSEGFAVGNLWHLHGFFKVEGDIKAGDLHSVLSPVFGKIHGSQVVDVKVVYNEKQAIKYAVKDAVKNFATEDGEVSRKRLFVSRRWLPAGFRTVNKCLNQWALLHRTDWEDDDVLDANKGYVGERLEYVPFVWDVKREYLKMWCKGEVLSLDFGDKHVEIIGKYIGTVYR